MLPSFLVATVRHETGKGANRKLRSKLQVPAVLYGNGETTLLELPEEPTRRFLAHLEGTHILVTLKVKDQEKGTEKEYQVMVQEVQQHAYKSLLLHIDFRLLDPAKPVTLKVPIEVVGIAPGVKKGGVLQVIARQVPISCLPKDIPAHIEADVSNLDLSQSIRAKELKYPASVTPKAKQNYTVVSLIGRAVKKV